MSYYAELAERYLRTVEDRDLDAAEAMLAPSPTFIFPKGMVFHDLRICTADRSTRYKTVRKKFEGFHTVDLDDEVVVYAFGTLHGMALDDTPIEGVRFLDRFTFKDGKITKQEVWNDLSL